MEGACLQRLTAAGYVTERGDAEIDRGTFDLSRLLRLPGTPHGRRENLVEAIGGTRELVPKGALLDALPELLTESRHSSTNGKPQPQDCEDDDVSNFLEEHAVAAECHYGRDTVNGHGTAGHDRT